MSTYLPVKGFSTSGKYSHYIRSPWRIKLAVKMSTLQPGHARCRMLENTNFLVIIFSFSFRSCLSPVLPFLTCSSLPRIWTGSESQRFICVLRFLRNGMPWPCSCLGAACCNCTWRTVCRSRIVHNGLHKIRQFDHACPYGWHRIRVQGAFNLRWVDLTLPNKTMVSGSCNRCRWGRS